MTRRYKSVDLALNRFLESGTDLSRAEFTAASGLSQDRFSQLFYQQMGMRPDEFFEVMSEFRREHRKAVQILIQVGCRVKPERIDPLPI
jgi:hypothetical protein